MYLVCIKLPLLYFVDGIEVYFIYSFRIWTAILIRVLAFKLVYCYTILYSDKFLIYDDRCSVNTGNNHHFFRMC